MSLFFLLYSEGLLVFLLCFLIIRSIKKRKKKRKTSQKQNEGITPENKLSKDVLNAKSNYSPQRKTTMWEFGPNGYDFWQKPMVFPKQSSSPKIEKASVNNAQSKKQIKAESLKEKSPNKSVDKTDNNTPENNTNEHKISDSLVTDKIIETEMKTKVPRQGYVVVQPARNQNIFQKLEEEHRTEVHKVEDNTMDWPMQSKDASGGYGFIEGPCNKEYSIRLTHRVDDDYIGSGSFNIVLPSVYKNAGFEIRSESASVNDKPHVTKKEEIFKVTSESAPGIHFWGDETIDIGGYILKTPLIYTVSDLSYIQEGFASSPLNLIKEQFLLLSDIPTDLKSHTHNYEELENSDFGVTILNFSLEQKAYFLDWLESCKDDWYFKTHCYSRYVDILWYRAFMEQKNLSEITIRFFQLSFFESGDRTNMKEMKRALCAYFLSIKKGLTFSFEDKKILAYNFERYFLHYHYMYKPAWNFDPIGMLSFLGHKNLPNAIAFLEYYGQVAERWEDEEKIGQTGYALASIAYFLKNMNMSFKNANLLKEISTTRYGFKLSIQYYGGVEFTAKNEITPLDLIKEVKTTTNKILYKTFYRDYFEEFSWDKEYDAIFEALPESIKRTNLDTAPVMRKIKTLLNLYNPSLLDALILFEEHKNITEYMMRYEGNRLWVEEKRKQLREKEKSARLEIEECNFLWNPSLKTIFLKKRLREKVNEKTKPYNYEILIENFDEEIPLSKVPITIIHLDS